MHSQYKDLAYIRITKYVKYYLFEINLNCNCCKRMAPISQIINNNMQSDDVVAPQTNCDVILKLYLSNSD